MYCLLKSHVLDQLGEVVVSLPLFELSGQAVLQPFVQPRRDCSAQETASIQTESITQTGDDQLILPVVQSRGLCSCQPSARFQRAGLSFFQELDDGQSSADGDICIPSCPTVPQLETDAGSLNLGCSRVPAVGVWSVAGQHVEEFRSRVAGSLPLEVYDEDDDSSLGSYHSDCCDSDGGGSVCCVQWGMRRMSVTRMMMKVLSIASMGLKMTSATVATV